MPGGRFRVGVDTGGTFTDLVIIGNDGRMVRRKVLSTPDDFSRGILQALREVFDELGISGADLDGFIHGTTVATNAILESSGARIGLLTTRGFRDVLEIARGRWGEDVHDLAWIKPPPLVPRAFRREVDERIGARGEVLRPLDEQQVRRELAYLQSSDMENVAVCLINSYTNPEHELRIREIARAEFPRMNVCISAEVLQEAREYERTSTAVVNAYLTPVVDRYLARLQHALASVGYSGGVQVMQSNGGVMSADAARRKPVNIVESGPAAGVLAACYLARQTGDGDLIAFDMGGTTAKATLIEGGKPFESAEYHVGGGMSQSGRGGGGQVIRVPSIEIAEVGAGGGSIAWLDAGGALRVGPRSAGAAPGPACYRLGGTEPTVTDAYAVLGFLNPSAIAGGARAIDVDLARAAIERSIADPSGLSVEEAAWGIFAVATSNMIRAVRAVSVERGRDARDYTLVAFGGAGPLHAAELGRAMGMQRVIVPNSPGLFSALGLLMADIQHKYSRTVLVQLGDLDDDGARALNETWNALELEAVGDLAAEGHRTAELIIERSASLQYLGQSFELVVDAPRGMLGLHDFETLASAFSRNHEQTYGYREPDSRVQLVSVRVTARASLSKASYAELGHQAMSDARQSRESATSVGSRVAWFGPEHRWKEARVVPRIDLVAAPVDGPAIVEEFDTTVVVPPGCRAALDSHGDIVLELDGATRPTEALSGEVNAMTLELVKNSLDSITDNMAGTMVRTARSLILRDSHDFSVALCNAKGELVTGGVGIAVHLGSIPNALAGALPALEGDLHEGDVIVMNDPYAGGMHLPDIFVIKPLFLDGALAGFAAAVAHMADVGGRVPGGNAADSVEVFQEGIRIPPTKLYVRGEPDLSFVRLLRANVRQPDILMADLYAEIAACNTAEAEFRAMARRMGSATLLRYMEALLDYGERMARAAIAGLAQGRYTFTDHIDDNGIAGDPVRIQVAVEVESDRISVDFAGTAPQVRSAINAPLAIIRTAVAFVVKAVVGQEIPNNSGFLRLLEVKAPAGSIVNMAFPAACAARAVTVYRVTDALFGAFAPLLPSRVPAAGDGGPAVISVGGEDERGASFVFMELVSSAFGGRPTADGLEGVASPIVNAQNTSCELIEATYPLRIEHYGLVADSGGPGTFRGGLAVRRDVRFLGRRAILQIRSDRAVVAPWGLAGGKAGRRSSNTLLLPDGTERALPSKIVIEVEGGTLWRHVTAGGGGWGDPAARSREAIDRDLSEEKVSHRHVQVDYGVALEESSTMLDP